MEKKMEQSLVEELGGYGAEKGPRFKIKKWGVVPPKRRSVKGMMFDEIVKSVCSLFHRCCHPAGSSGEASTSQPKNCASLEVGMVHMLPYREVKNMRIFPKKDHSVTIARQNNPIPN